MGTHSKIWRQQPNPTSRCGNNKQVQESTQQVAAVLHLLHLPCWLRHDGICRKACHWLDSARHQHPCQSEARATPQSKRASHQPLSCGFVLSGGVFLDGWFEEWLRLV